MNHTFLLICYSYPPYPGTGGRRWAKLSKYLAREGNKIHVINSVSDHTPSVWQKDTEHPNIRLYSVANKYERMMHNAKQTFASKIIHKIVFFLSKIKTNANYADQSVWWNDSAYLKAKEILKTNSINYLIISCPPYHTMDKFSDLKKEFPHIKIVLDYRDIWIISQKEKGFFSHLSNKRFLHEKNKEISAITKADYIFTVADKMTEAIQDHFKTKKVATIYNGFDEEDTDENYRLEDTSYLKPGKINILFAGSLVSDSNPYAIPFFNALTKLKQEKPELYVKISLCVFGNVNLQIQHIIKKNDLHCVSIVSPVSSKAIGKVYKEFDLLLLFLNPYYTYAFISKFFDYLPARKPIVCVSERGTFSDYLESNSLGKNLDPTTIYVNLVDILSLTTDIKINTSFDISQFSYRELSQKFLKNLN